MRECSEFLRGRNCHGHWGEKKKWVNSISGKHRKKGRRGVSLHPSVRKLSGKGGWKEGGRDPLRKRMVDLNAGNQVTDKPRRMKEGREKRGEKGSRDSRWREK